MQKHKVFLVKQGLLPEGQAVNIAEIIVFYKKINGSEAAIAELQKTEQMLIQAINNYDNFVKKPEVIQDFLKSNILQDQMGTMVALAK